MWFSGLRGAIAFALALNIPGEDRSIWLTTTLAVVMFTTFFCGGFMAPLVRRMQLTGEAIPDAIVLVPETARNRGGQDSDTSGRHEGKLYRKFKRWDFEYMQPLFGGVGHDRVEHRRKRREKQLRNRSRRATIQERERELGNEPYDGFDAKDIRDTSMESLLHGGGGEAGLQDSKTFHDDSLQAPLMGFRRASFLDPDLEVTRVQSKHDSLVPLGHLDEENEDGDLDDLYARQADEEATDEDLEDQLSDESLGEEDFRALNKSGPPNGSSINR